LPPFYAIINPMIRPPGVIHEQSENCIKLHVTQQIISLCKDKQTEWLFLANKWARYKTSWTKALNIVPKMDRIESFSVTHIISDRSRLIDVENLYGGSKPIRDKFERLGWIYNDSPKWSDLIIEQRKVKKGEECTWIKITLDIPSS